MIASLICEKIIARHRKRDEKGASVGLCDGRHRPCGVNFEVALLRATFARRDEEPPSPRGEDL